jgi:hypothetical protein
MQYKYIPIDSEEKEEYISRFLAREMIRKCYGDVNHVIENAEKLFGNRIRVQFGYVEIEK